MPKKKKAENKELALRAVQRMEQKPLSWLRPYERNSRTHSETQIEQIAASLKRFGFRMPILAKADGEIIAGHGRYYGSKRLGLETVPVVIADDMTEEEARAYVIADNKIGENAGWDYDLYFEEIFSLDQAGFDMESMGIDALEMEDLYAEYMQEEEVPGEPPETNEEETIEPPEVPVSQLGDVWLLGKHRLVCGDCTDKKVLEIALEGKQAALLHTDPPYNVDYENAARGKPGRKDLGKIKNDSMSPEKFRGFLLSFYKTAFACLLKDATAYIWHSDRESPAFRETGIEAGFVYDQTIIWKKPMLLSRKKYHWAHEPCLLFTKGKPYFTDDRTKTTVWDFGGYDSSKNEHPTQKPLFLPREAISNSTKPGDLVLDCFGGSGSSLLACEELKRKCAMIELDPAFCDVIVKRWQRQTRKKATLEATDRTFADTKKARLNG